MEYIRELYLSKIRPFYESDLIKVLSGIRRAGKSRLLTQVQNEISKNTKKDHIINVNFEDIEFSFITNAMELNKYIKSKINDLEKYYIFLDEIQHVVDFEKALASFKATLNCSLFVTGSNSTLLKGHLATLLTGRTIKFHVFPFTYKESLEYLKLNNKLPDKDFIFDYIKWGGFPQRFEMPNENSIRSYLVDLLSSIKYKDIVMEHQIDKNKFDAFSAYIFANCGNTISMENISNYFNTNTSNGKTEIKKATLYNYLEYLESAFLIQKIPRYDISGKKVLLSLAKIYTTDTGLSTISTNTIKYQDTFFLENIIYTELITRDYTVFVGKTNKGEVDFIAIKNGKKCFIQVCYLLADEKTVNREFSAFSNFNDASPKFVLSLDRIDFSHDGITHLNIEDFLMGKVDLILS